MGTQTAGNRKSSGGGGEAGWGRRRKSWKCRRNAILKTSKTEQNEKLHFGNNDYPHLWTAAPLDKSLFRLLIKILNRQGGMMFGQPAQDSPGLQHSPNEEEM